LEILRKEMLLSLAVRMEFGSWLLLLI